MREESMKHIFRPDGDQTSASDTIITSTYEELFGEGGLAESGTLVLGQRYSFEYKARFHMPGTNPLIVHEGNAETFVATADSTSTVDLVVRSIENPHDFIKYTPRNDIYADGQSQTGTVVWRDYTLRKIAADFDWRHLVCRCWERVAESGVFSQNQDLGGMGYYDFPVFRGIPDVGNIDENISIASITLLTHRAGDDGQWDWPHMVFQGPEIYKVFMDWGNDHVIITGTINDMHHGCCSGIFVEGDVIGYFSTPSMGPRRVIGNLRDVSFFSTVLYIIGNWNGVQLNPGHNCTQIHGDHTNVVFGPENQGPGVLGPELIADPRFNDPNEWSLTGSSITDGVLTFGDGGSIIETTPTVAKIGRTYIIEVLRVDSTPASQIIVNFGGVSSSVLTEQGLHRFELTPINTNGFSIGEDEFGGGAQLARVSVKIKI